MLLRFPDQLRAMTSVNVCAMNEALEDGTSQRTRIHQLAVALFADPALGI